MNLHAAPLALLLLAGPALAGQAPRVVADWDFGSLTTPAAGTPAALPLLEASESNVIAGIAATGLFPASAQASFSGLAWSDANAAPGELNLRYFDGDPSNAATNGDGINDNYLTFTLSTTGAPIRVDRIEVSAWRNGAGAVDRYRMEVVVDEGDPEPFGDEVVDGQVGDGVFDWFAFDGDVTALSTLEVRFRPVSSPGVPGTGNLHVNGLRVETGNPPPPPPAPPGPNVLFLIADDLTANALQCYGNAAVQTPNIDSLAAQGTRFTRAYCQFPVCAASRASMLSGMYTERLTGAGGGYANLDAVLGPHPTLPEHFRQRGYTSARVSKLYHMRVPGDITNGVAGPDHASSWDLAHNVQAPEWQTPGATGHYTNETLDFSQPTAHYDLGFGAAFYAVAASTSGAEQADVLAVDQALDYLQQLQDEPFFLAVGFVRPHVPLVAPAATFALYPPASLALAPSVPGDLNDIPAAGIFWNEPARGPNTDLERRLVLQAYYASVTFMDEQVGRLLARLDELELTDETIVVFTSDHGYHLGEHTMWQKLSLHEESARVPLIVRGPGVRAGAATDGLTELIDLYPTLSELAGLAIPAACQGLSLADVLSNGARSPRAAATSRVSGGQLLRTAEFAYMRYGSAEELYRMTTDPLQFTNLASDPGFAADLSVLRAQLDAKNLAVQADPGTACCFGDGTLAPCPCGPDGAPGEGCENSTGRGATLTGGGSADLTSPSLRLCVAGAPADALAILLEGVAAAPTSFGAGLLGTAPRRRLLGALTDAAGEALFEGPALRPIVSGSSGATVTYQCVYQDAGGPCGGLNATNGWTVTWR